MSDYEPARLLKRVLPPTSMPMESLPVLPPFPTGRDSIGIACRDSIGIGGGSLFRRVADKGSDTRDPYCTMLDATRSI